MVGLDVHVLIHPATKREWVAKCLDSVRDSAARAGYPVAVHAVAVHVLGHIGASRAEAYALGSHPYVTSVDDDDWIDPDAFALLAGALRNDPVAVTTQCMAHQGGHAWRLPWRTNLRVFRRDVAATAPLDAWPVYDGPMMLAHADSIGTVIELDVAPYHWRLHTSHHRALVQSIGNEARARARSLPPGVHMSRIAA